jgi:hypothetical protein
MYGAAQNLNACDKGQEDFENEERRLVYRASSFQSAIHSIHFYPFVTVVEKAGAPTAELISAKHGTQWQPFLK